MTQDIRRCEASSAELCAAQLRNQGYLILENYLPNNIQSKLYSELDPHFHNAPFCSGAFYGETTRRFGAVFNRSKTAQLIATDAYILAIVTAVLGDHCERLQLNLTQGIEIFPNAPVQVPHRDHDMWWGEKGRHEYMINVMWALDDFTQENGATRVWPGSNHGDLSAMRPDDEAVSATMPRGSACLFLGSTLHSGGENCSIRSRRGLIISYCLGWLLPFENQWLAYPPEKARELSPELQALIGYRQHRPSLNNYEGQCPSVLLNDAPWKPYVDALRSDQQEQIRLYTESRSLATMGAPS